MKSNIILKRALEDKLIPDIDIITKDNPEVIKNLLDKYPKSKYFSEWRYEMVGNLRYKYRSHSDSVGKNLMVLYSEGTTSNLPRLTKVYTRKELSNLISKS